MSGDEYSMGTLVGQLDFDKYGLAEINAEQEAELQEDIDSTPKHIFTIVTDKEAASFRAEIDALPKPKTSEELIAEHEAELALAEEKRLAEEINALELAQKEAEEKEAERLAKEIAEGEAIEKALAEEETKEVVKKGGRPPKYS